LLPHERRAGVPQTSGVAAQSAKPGQQDEHACRQRHEHHAVHDPPHRRPPPAFPWRRPVGASGRGPALSRASWTSKVTSTGSASVQISISSLTWLTPVSPATAS